MDNPDIAISAVEYAVRIATSALNARMPFEHEGDTQDEREARCVVQALADAGLLADEPHVLPDVEMVGEAMHADDCADDECDGGDMGDYDRQARIVLALFPGRTTRTCGSVSHADRIGGGSDE